MRFLPVQTKFCSDFFTGSFKRKIDEQHICSPVAQDSCSKIASCMLHSAFPKFMTFMKSDKCVFHKIFFLQILLLPITFEG